MHFVLLSDLSMAIPPPASEVSIGSTTVLAKHAATTASKAFPPFLSIMDAASAVRGWPQATTFFIVITKEKEIYKK